MISERTLSRLETAKAIAVGGDPIDSIASLCVYSPTLVIETVTDLIGCSPSHAHLKGDFATPKATIPARIGLWALDAPESLPFVEKIKHLLHATTGQISAWRRLAEEHDLQLRCAIYLHSWTEGFEIEPAVLGQVAERGWKFGLSIYSASGDEIVDAFLSIQDAKSKM